MGYRLHPLAELFPPPTAEAGDLLHVSRRSVQAAKRVLAHGTPGLVQAVERGTLAVSAAAALTASRA